MRASKEGDLSHLHLTSKRRFLNTQLVPLAGSLFKPVDYEVSCPFIPISTAPGPVREVSLALSPTIVDSACPSTGNKRKSGI